MTFVLEEIELIKFAQKFWIDEQNTRYSPIKVYFDKAPVDLQIISMAEIMYVIQTFAYGAPQRRDYNQNTAINYQQMQNRLIYDGRGQMHGEEIKRQSQIQQQHIVQHRGQNYVDMNNGIRQESSAKKFLRAFIAEYFIEIKIFVCKKENTDLIQKGTRYGIPSLVTGLGVFISQHTTLSGPMAAAFATAILILVLDFGQKAFCRASKDLL